MLVGGIAGGGKSVHDSYIYYRHRSYSECASQTTMYGLFGIVFGAGVGVWVHTLAPILIPVSCVALPIAGGTVIVKYFDKNIKSQ